MNKKRKKYPRKKPVRQVRSTTKIRYRRKPKRNKAIQGISKALRLILIFAISGFLIYTLFKSDNKFSSTETSPAQSRAVKEPDEQIEEQVEKKVIDLDTLTVPEKLTYYLDQIYKSYDIQSSWIKKRNRLVKVQLPPDLPAIEIIVDIIQRINELGLNYATRENLKRSNSWLTIFSDQDTLVTILFSMNTQLQRKITKMAIIIDDFGYYNNEVIDDFFKLEFPITLSIIPGQRFSKTIAEKAKKYHKNVMLHLPMEAIDKKVEKSKYTILTDMSAGEIKKRVNSALKEIPEAIAVNNHMGSKATADARVMDILISELKKKNIMFVDSRTTPNSVGYEIAKKHNLPYVKRTIFLDGAENLSEDYIQRQLQKAVKIADKKGCVVVIGHPYKETISVLNKELPKIEKKGMKIVSVTEIKN